MADEQHLNILANGVDSWNTWRKDYPGISPDLSGAGLIRATLSGVNFSRANLMESHLLDSNLNGANLEGTNFTGSDLSGATFSYSQMSGAVLNDCLLIRSQLQVVDLKGADLSGADMGEAQIVQSSLNDADLQGVNLAGALLESCTFRGTNLKNAKLNGTRLLNLDLTGARGLQFCDHRGPVHIDLQTLSSGASLPAEFLAGCGISPTAASFFASGNRGGYKPVRCFISHAAEDLKFVEKLQQYLLRNDISSWLDNLDQPHAERSRLHLDRKLHLTDRVLIVFSKHSINRAWLREEIKLVANSEKERQRHVFAGVSIDNALEKSNERWAHALQEQRSIIYFHNWDYEEKFREGIAELVPRLKF